MATGIAEEEPQLALHYALAISKVVRIDFPGEWPDAITSLISMLRTTSISQLHLRRGLTILLHIVKELSTARLRRSQTSLQSLTPEIVLVLTNIYIQKAEYWQKAVETGRDEKEAVESMENSLLAMRILRRLLIAGYEYPNHETEVRQLWSYSQQQFGQVLVLAGAPSVTATPQIKELTEKHLIQLSKLHTGMADTHPAAFVLLPDSLELARAYWDLVEKYSDMYAGSEATGADNKDRDAMERLSLKGLVLLRHCLKMVFSPTKSFKFRSPEVKVEQENAIQVMKSQLWTAELVSRIANVLVTKFFVFRASDLEAWDEVSCFRE